MRRVALLVVLAIAPVLAMGAQVTGRVVRVVNGDTALAPGAMVTLHRVGTDTQGPVDSMRVGRSAIFQFRVTPDSSDILLVSARWQGVDYFAAPVVSGQVVTLVAVDTSSNVPVTISARHVIIGGPAPDGSRDVVDLIVVGNSSNFTRSASDSITPIWTMVVPPLVANLMVGDADFSRAAFDLHGDTLILNAPIPPGERQFFLQYQLPPHAKQFVLPLTPSPDTLSILTEEVSLKMDDQLVEAGHEEVQGRNFTRYSAGKSVDTSVVIGFDENGPPPEWLLPLLLVVVALPLAWATRRALLQSS